MTLVDLFASLGEPARDGDLPCFSTVIIGAGPHRLGRNADGAPALLVSLAGARAGGGVSVELGHLGVRHGVTCRLWRAGAEPETATLTVIQCRQPDRLLRDYFLGAMEGLLSFLGPRPSVDRVREVVAGVIELFRALELPPRKSVQGLWAELYVIVQAADATALARAWHVAPEEPYDFIGGLQRVEVKSTTGDERRHYFALAQIHPPIGTTALVASVFVERAGGGVSLRDLLDRVRSRLAGSPDLVLRVDQVVAATLGTNWRNGLVECFDWERAQASLALFEASRIPSILPAAVPSGVSDVRFQSDLSRVIPMAEAAIREREGLFRSLLPARGLARP